MPCLRLIFFITMGLTQLVLANSLEGRLFSNDSKNYSGQILEVQGSYLFRQGLKFNIEDQNLVRTFKDGVQVTDNYLTFASIWNASKQTYLDLGISAGSTANVYAKNAYYVTPHYVSGNSDYSIMLKYAEYKALKAGTMAPQYFYSLNDRSGFGVGAFFVSTDKIIAAYQTQALWGFTERNSIRVGLAAGRAIEDAGLEADFNSVSTEYTFQYNPRWKYQFIYQTYWSTVRSEQTIGLGVGYRDF